MKLQRPTRLADRSGFTIIEVLLAMGILLMGSVAIIAFLTFGGATAHHAQLRTQAASAIEAVVADIDRNIFPYVDGELGEPIELTKRPVPGARGVVYNAKATVNPDNEREYRIDISMTWESAGMKRAKTWSMLRIKEVPFGERLRREFIEGSGGFKKTESQSPGAVEENE
jgi:prepilin-type N-terminal cleavage/methylation domain-containing protein